MSELEDKIITLQGQFSLSDLELDEIAASFAAAMTNGLTRKNSSLKMLPAFISRPTGTECGEYLVLDFGGSNLRLLLVKLSGARRFEIIRQASWLVRQLSPTEDLTASTASAEQLFAAIADKIAEFVPTGAWRLGHTFSFPCQQLSPNQAQLLQWTKEFKTSGAVGADINQLLAAALKQRGLERIRPQVILNDTVATYLAAAYSDLHVVAGAVAGTGHNSAYFEPALNSVINLEAGDFRPSMGTGYDLKLDQASEHAGSQLFEKQVAGRYLGELLRLILLDLIQAGQLSIDPRQLAVPYCIDTQLLGRLLTPTLPSHSQAYSQFCPSDWSLNDPSQYQAIRAVAAMLVRRAAQLTAASFMGILRCLPRASDERRIIAVDGSLYEKMPDYRDQLEQVLINRLPHITARTRLMRGGSAVGAAVAAAIINK